jgi:hypothetical protein
VKLFDGETVAILATGPSMSQSLVDSLPASVPLIAVSDAYRLAPHAKALVAQDRKWWNAHPDAMQFEGPKFSCYPMDGITQVFVDGAVTTGTNSGALALYVAVKHGAKKVLLLGFDMHGDHFFGRHPEPLTNTLPYRFRIFMQQFRRLAGLCKREGVRVVNCTPGSSLTCFPFGTVAEQV